MGPSVASEMCPLPAFKKKPTLDELWKRVKLQGHPYVFDNRLAIEVSQGTGFKNHNDLTKIDTYDDLSDSMKVDDVFIAHIGGPNKTEQKHRFVQGAKLAYHQLEDIPDPPEECQYRRTILDEIDRGEASLLSTVFNQELIQLFLYGDRTVRPRIHLPGRTSGKEDNSFTYSVGHEEVSVQSLQIEMDFIVEKNGDVAFAEAKRGSLWTDFAIAQVYMPYRKLLKIRDRVRGSFQVHPLFIMQYSKPHQPKGLPAKRYDHIRIYEYKFESPEHMDSVSFVKAKEYVMVPT